MKHLFRKWGVLILGGCMVYAIPSISTADRGEGTRKTETDKAPNPDIKLRDYWVSSPVILNHALGTKIDTSNIDISYIDVGCRAGEKKQSIDQTNSVKIEVAYSANGSTASEAWQKTSSSVCHMGPSDLPTKTCPFLLEKSGYWLIRCRIEPNSGEVETSPEDNVHMIRVTRIKIR